MATYICDKRQACNTYGEQQASGRDDSLKPISPNAHNPHRHRHTREPSPRLLHKPLPTQFLLHTLPIDNSILICSSILRRLLNDNQILIPLMSGRRGRRGRRSLCILAASSSANTQIHILHNLNHPRFKPNLATVEPVIAPIRAHQRRNRHPDQIRMFAMTWRQGVCQQDTAIGNVGQSQRVLAV